MLRAVWTVSCVRGRKWAKTEACLSSVRFSHQFDVFFPLHNIWSSIEQYEHDLTKYVMLNLMFWDVNILKLWQAIQGEN